MAGLRKRKNSGIEFEGEEDASDEGDDFDEEEMNLAVALSLSEESMRGGREPSGQGSVAGQESMAEQDLMAEMESGGDDVESARHSWGMLESLLRKDYIRAEKESLASRLQRELPTLSSVRVDVLKWMEPELSEEVWSSYILRNSGLRMVLYEKRRQLYEYVKLLGSMYGKGEAPTEKLTGHHVCGALGMLKIAVKVEDIVLMIKYAANGAEICDSELEWSHNSANRLMATENETPLLSTLGFERRFRSLLNKAQWPASGEQKRRSAEQRRDDHHETLLPAFDYDRAPPEFSLEISWESWCKAFDKVKLRIEKNGRLW